MKIIEAITRADDICRNSYSQQQKIDWLREAEYACWREIMQTRKRYDANHTDLNWFESGFDPDVKTTLLMEPPYDTAYVHYLESKIHYANEEFDLYNASAAQYETFYQAWKNRQNSLYAQKTSGRFLF